MALEVKECISYKYKAKRKNYERERVEATCILVLILIEQLTTCYIWLTFYVKEKITNSARCNMNKQNSENRPLHFMKKNPHHLYTQYSACCNV